MSNYFTESDVAFIGKFRKCHKNERRNFAAMLSVRAKRGSYECVSELIRMARGGIHTSSVYGRRHLWSLFPSLLQEERWEFDLDEQVIAYESLGKSANLHALHYLERISLFTHEFNLTENVRAANGKRDRQCYYTVYCPYASGPAAKTLRENTQEIVESDRKGCEAAIAEAESKIRQKREYMTIANAIVELKGELSRKKQ